MSKKNIYRIFSLLLLAGIILGITQYNRVMAGITTQTDPFIKVEGTVLDELATKGQTDYFIWMVEKADLSPAYQLQTQAEKGQFVFDTLLATADRTQAALPTRSWYGAAT
jgi:hypothetical protein